MLNNHLIYDTGAASPVPLRLNAKLNCVLDLWMLFFSPQAEVCSGTVAEVIQSVVNGADGCIFCFGQVKLGKLLRWREIKQQHLSTKKALSALCQQRLEPTIGLSVQWGESRNGKLEERNGE